MQTDFTDAGLILVGCAGRSMLLLSCTVARFNDVTDDIFRSESPPEDPLPGRLNGSGVDTGCIAACGSGTIDCTGTGTIGGAEGYRGGATEGCIVPGIVGGNDCGIPGLIIADGGCAPTLIIGGPKFIPILGWFCWPIWLNCVIVIVAGLLTCCFG